eukprot:1149884-Rhodomonas_salina.4
MHPLSVAAQNSVFRSRGPRSLSRGLSELTFRSISNPQRLQDQRLDQREAAIGMLQSYKT